MYLTQHLMHDKPCEKATNNCGGKSDEHCQELTQCLAFRNKVHCKLSKHVFYRIALLCTAI